MVRKRPKTSRPTTPIKSKQTKSTQAAKPKIQPNISTPRQTSMKSFITVTNRRKNIETGKLKNSEISAGGVYLNTRSNLDHPKQKLV